MAPRDPNIGGGEMREKKETEKLKQCPFCGSEAKADMLDEFVERKLYFVGCIAVNCGIGTDYYDTPELAAAAWNRRVEVEDDG